MRTHRSVDLLLCRSPVHVEALGGEDTLANKHILRVPPLEPLFLNLVQEPSKLLTVRVVFEGDVGYNDVAGHMEKKELLLVVRDIP